MNSVTSALTQKLLSFNKYNTNNQYHDGYTYANLRKQRLSLIYGYCDENSDYIISSDITMIIFAYYTSMLSWKVNGETMKQFKAAKYRQMMIGPRFNLGGTTLALTMYPMDG